MVNISTIKNVDVRAMWNGSQDEAVQVNVSITVDGQPDSRVALLDVTDELIDNASVQSIQRVPSIATALVSKNLRQHSSEFSGDTLVPSDAREFLDTIRMQELGIYESDERQVEVMKANNTWPVQYVQEHTSRLFGDALDIQNAEASLYLPLHTPCVGSYMARGELNSPKRPHRLFPLVRPSLCPHMMNDGHNQVPPPRPYTDSEVSGERSRSISGGTVEIHRPSSPSLSSVASLREAITTPDDWRSTSPRDSSTPRHRNSGFRAKATPVKPPWKSPIYQDFARKNKPVHSPTQLARFSPSGRSTSPWSTSSAGDPAPKEKPVQSPTQLTQSLSTVKNNLPQSITTQAPGMQHSDTDKLESKSMDSLNGPLHGLKSETLEKIPKSKQQRYTVGRASGRKFKPKAKDEILNSRYYASVPLFARSCLSFPSTSLHDGAQELKDGLPCIEDSDVKDPNPTESISVLGQLVPDPPSYIDGMFLHHATRLPSPSVFPRVWLRRDNSPSINILRNPTLPATVSTEPYWAKDDGMIYLAFPHEVTAGIYQVELEANLKLSRPYRCGWQSFKVSGLPSNEGKENTGGFELIVKPKLDGSGFPELEFDTGHLLDARTLGSRELIARFRLLDPLLLYLRSKERIRDINNWNTAVTLYTVPAWSMDEGTQMKHHASLTFEVPDRDLFAENVRFSIIVKYGPREGRSYILGTYEDSVSLANDEGLEYNQGPNASEAEITITRSMRNLEKPIDLYFVLNYPDSEYVTLSLPTFRPNSGKALSERIMLLKASPPLFLDLLARGHLSTWKMTEQYNGEETWMCLDRVDTPPLFPDGLKDDAMIRIRKLCPVHYEALETCDDPLLPEHPSNLVRDIDIRLEKVFGEELECRMSLGIQVGSSCRLLTVDDHDWIPSFFTIDGQLATEKSGEWRENEEGYKTLFKSSTMTSGQIVRLEMHWKELVISDEFKGDGVDKAKIEYKLPSILGKLILGGTLVCRIDEATVILSDNKKETSYQFLDLYNLDTTRLPEMQAGYNMKLSFVRQGRSPPPLEPAPCVATSSEKIRFFGGYPLPKRRVRFEDEESESSDEAPEATMSFTDAEEDAESIVSSEFDENPPPIFVSRLRDLGPVRSQHPQRWTDRAKNCVCLTYVLLDWLARYVLLGYLFVLLTGIGSETVTDGRAIVDYFDPNDFVSDLLPSPIASLQRYFQPAQDGLAYDSKSTGGSKQQTEDFPFNDWNHITDEETTSTEQPQPAPTSTKIAYVDWIDRALGWKGVAE